MPHFNGDCVRGASDTFTMLRLWLLCAALLLACCVVTPAVAQAPGNADLSEEEANSDGDTDYWIYVHGILMSLGWVALLPLGALIAQNRWLQRFKTQVARKEVWFWLHVAIQATGAALIIAAIGIAYSPTSQMEPDKDETIAYTHKVIGTIAFAFLLLQIVGGIIRPHPGARGRTIWNHIHHNTGRLAVLLAWVNIWLGVATWYDGGGGNVWNGLNAWVVPLAGGYSMYCARQHTKQPPCTTCSGFCSIYHARPVGLFDVGLVTVEGRV
eukprot:GHUV01013460.1.p1 GENE.GHUV01013460.1~~GHUV01013460.1.p1  ORF type:complete len:269 (+),score=19.05 GHUV01013460.1:93-899(+)